jgi:hypothetical protein
MFDFVGNIVWRDGIASNRTGQRCKSPVHETLRRWPACGPIDKRAVGNSGRNGSTSGTWISGRGLGPFLYFLVVPNFSDFPFAIPKGGSMPSTDFTSFASDLPAEAVCRPSTGLASVPGGWLTSGAVARDAGVTPRTVRNWCDHGLLHCERLPSGHRRIPAQAWELFKAGASRAEQDAATVAYARKDDLEMRIRGATSPQEVIDLLRNERGAHHGAAAAKGRAATQAT